MSFLRIILGILLISSSGSLFAQQENYERRENRRQNNTEEQFEYNSDNDGKKWDWSKVRVGGNFGMQFGTGRVFIDAAPTFGYQINHIVEAGVGFRLLYYRERSVLFDNSLNTFDFKTLSYGPIAYGRFTVWNGIFLMAQYEMTNQNKVFRAIGELDGRVNVHNLLVGGGYSQPIGNMGNIYMQLLYEVINDPNSIYRFGTFGNIPLHFVMGVGFGFGR